MEDSKGKLDVLFQNHIIQEYIYEGGFCGYLGHENRTDETDLALEELLKLNSTNCSNSDILSEDLIAEWICSRYGRYFMNSYTTIENFKENIADRIVYYQTI
jgi:hypothetical protein